MPHPLLVYFALIVVQVLFGINYIVSKFVVYSIPPLLWGSIRNLGSLVLLLIIAGLFYRKSFPKKNELKSYLWPLLGFSILGGVLNQAFFLSGLKYTSATNASIINTMIPVFTVFFVTLRGLEQLTTRKVLGFTLAFFGVLVLRKIEEFTLSHNTAYGDILMLLNAMSFGAFLAFSKNFMQNHSKVWSTAFMFFYAGVGLTFLSIPDYLHLPQVSWSMLLIWACLFSVFGATLIPYFLNNWALGYSKASTVAILIYIQPIITMFLNWQWFSVIPSYREMISSVIIFSGVVLVVTQKSKKKKNKEIHFTQSIY